MTVWLVWIWTDKNADEKAHTFSRRSKNVKKRTKNGYRYCVNSLLGTCNSLKTMATDKLFQRTEYYYYCMLIYIQSLLWPATRPHYLLNFGSEKIGPLTIKLAFTVHILHMHNNDKTSQMEHCLFY